MKLMEKIQKAETDKRNAEDCAKKAETDKKIAEKKTKQLEKEKREIQMQKDALKEIQNLAKSGSKYDKSLNSCLNV